MPNQYGMLFILGKDRPGIVENVTGILFEMGANLEDLSMTLLEGQFAMMLSFEIQSKRWKKLEEKTFQLQSKPWSLHVHMVSLTRPQSQLKHSQKSILITAIGKDRTGIVHILSSDLAKISANITNLDCRLLKQSKKNNLYSLALEVDLKKDSDLKEIQKLIQSWEKKLKIEVKLHSSESAVF